MLNCGYVPVQTWESMSVKLVLVATRPQLRGMSINANHIPSTLVCMLCRVIADIGVEWVAAIQLFTEMGELGHEAFHYSRI